jgi:hypothetical protein
MTVTDLADDRPLSVIRLGEPSLMNFKECKP